MVLLQEFLHPPRASRDDCGERITQKSIPSRVAKSVYLVLIIFMQSFKGPIKKLKPVKPSAALQGRHITMPHLALCYKRKSSSTCGSNRSNGRRPRHGNTKPHARNSILGVHHSDHDSNSKRHPGDRSLQPSM